MICVVYAVVTTPFCCLKMFHKWQSPFALTSGVEIALLPLHVCDKGKAEACTLACSACSAVQGKVTLGHTKLPALGFEALWVLFCPGWCSLSVRKEARVRGMKKASERRWTAARGKGTNQRLAKKSQAKDRVSSSALPCLCELQELEVMLGS